MGGETAPVPGVAATGGAAGFAEVAGASEPLEASEDPTGAELGAPEVAAGGTVFGKGFWASRRAGSGWATDDAASCPTTTAKAIDILSFAIARLSE